jgi:hypothetical protein
MCGAEELVATRVHEQAGRVRRGRAHACVPTYNVGTHDALSHAGGADSSSSARSAPSACRNARRTTSCSCFSTPASCAKRMRSAAARRACLPSATPRPARGPAQARARPRRCLAPCVRSARARPGARTGSARASTPNLVLTAALRARRTVQLAEAVHVLPVDEAREPWGA